MKAAATLLLFIFSLYLLATTPPASSDSELNDTASHPPQNLNTSLYTCNLITVSGQCREYQVLSGAKDRFFDLKDGCESMGGVFGQAECPTAKAIAKCADIVRNYNQPDVIYNNYYYRVEGLQLNGAFLSQVCAELGGDLSKLSEQ